MSNVLIGIIGVILFIGLALAGALILGDDFRSASSDSQAAAAVAQAQQVQAAVEMWRLKTGQSTFPNQDTTFLVPRFLKSAATNPTSAGRANQGSYIYSVHFNNDIYMDGNDEGRVPTASHLMIVLGAVTDAKAKGTCQTIAEQFTSGVILSSNPTPTGLGCAIMQDNYVLFSKL
jgi:hypothetical protein